MSTYNEMKKKAESDQNRIELRSEKVRNMIGEMPSFLIRWGNTILVVIFVLLALIAWFAFFSNCFSDRKDRKYIEDGKRKGLIIILNTEHTERVLHVQSYISYICCSPPPEPPLFISSLLIPLFTFLMASFKVPKR